MDVAFGGKAGVGPDFFEVNEGALARAKQQMLQGGEREELLVGF